MAMATSKSQSWRDQGSGSVDEAQGIVDTNLTRIASSVDFQTQKVAKILISWELAFHAGTTTAWCVGSVQSQGDVLWRMRSRPPSLRPARLLAKGFARGRILRILPAVRSSTAMVSL